MKISQLIAQLQEILDDQGDIRIVTEYDHMIGDDLNLSVSTVIGEQGKDWKQIVATDQWWDEERQEPKEWGSLSFDMGLSGGETVLVI